MLSFIRRCCVTACVFILLTACSRSHIPLQFEGSELYYGGLVDIDVAVDQFNQTHEFEHVKVYIFDLGQITSRLEDGSFNHLHAATVATDRLYAFYYVNLSKHGNYTFVEQDRSKYANFVVDITLLNRDQEPERKMYAQLVDEDYVIIDAY